MELKNKTILITGGSSGIGLESIQHFLNEGMKVIVCGRNKHKNDFVRQKYQTVEVVDCDITSSKSRDELFKFVEKYGGIDIIYNNAAVINMYDLVEMKDMTSQFAEEEIKVNYLAIIELNSLFMNMIESKKEAAIINTTSAVAYVPINFIPTYSSSKAALQSYTISLREQLKKQKSRIKVYELIPPTVDTDVTKNFKGQKVSTTIVVKQLIKGLKTNSFTIKVTIVKMLYLINRISPAFAFKMLNK